MKWRCLNGSWQEPSWRHRRVRCCRNCRRRRFNSRIQTDARSWAPCRIQEGQVFNLCLCGWTWGIRNVLKDAGFQYLKTNQDGSTPATGNQTVDWQILKANDEAIIRAFSSIAACAPLALTVDADFPTLPSEVRRE